MVASSASSFHLLSPFRSTDPFDFESGRKTAEDLRRVESATKNSALVKYYQRQNDRIDRCLRPVHEHARIAREGVSRDVSRTAFLMTGSCVATFILAPLQVYSASASGSLALIVVAVDAVASLLSYSITPACAVVMSSIDSMRYPVGKSRMETIGHILFSFLVAIASSTLVVVSIEQLVSGSHTQSAGSGSHEPVHIASIVIVCLSFTVNLFFHLLGLGLEAQSCLVSTICGDFVDKLVINAFGILTAVGGSRLRWWIDPVGSMIISSASITHVYHTVWEHFRYLIGVTADVDPLQHITYLALTHSQLILALDSVRAWYSGTLLIVEVDIVMDRDETLRASHDVAEELQMKLEALPWVERAYVHVDYETTHRAEHSLLKLL